jgi:hypothetical protein
VTDTTLLAGPYTPPPLRKGDRATCLYRDALVVVTSLTTAPIPWPRCQATGIHGGAFPNSSIKNVPPGTFPPPPSKS